MVAELSARNILATLALLLPVFATAEASTWSPPDLRVLALWTTDAEGSAEATAGQARIAHALVANVGEAPAGAFSVRFSWDRDETSFAVVEGLAGRSQTVVDGLAIQATSGAHELRAFADARADVLEARETNNEYSALMDVRPGAVRLDAVITQQEAVPFRPVVYELVAWNAGNEARSLRLTATGGGPGWTHTLSTTVLDLSPGQEQAVRLAVTPRPGGAPATVVVSVTEGRTVLESLATRTTVA
jgi:subtilase family serine protease